MIAAAASGVKVGGLEDCAHAQGRRRQFGIGNAEDRGVAARGVGQSEQHAKSGCLARSVWSQEARDGSRLNGERQVVNGDHVAVFLG